MKTYLFVWNPKRWPWINLEEQIGELNRIGSITDRWSCGNTKSIQTGDRAFLVKVGEEPKGIMASGEIVSQPFADKHWNNTDKEANYVDIRFDVLLNPKKESILILDILKQGKLVLQNWTPQSSGISIRPDLSEELEAVWFDFISTQNIRHNPFSSGVGEREQVYIEGTSTYVLVTRYERNPFARKECLSIYGSSCQGCGFSFEKVYGEVAKDFIHVHHLVPLAQVGKAYQVNPKTDLIPLCANCHSVVHLAKPMMTIEELKKSIGKT